jgi:hypothetical protein
MFVFTAGSREFRTIFASTAAGMVEKIISDPLHFAPNVSRHKGRKRNKKNNNSNNNLLPGSNTFTIFASPRPYGIILL